ncbi:tax1-binding protein 1 homolog [Lineus longissimus]|uniref:tax1-binding protein 1 homolog n=1 Tax=Lineus longissimus TaxID=88925 RepID=UPI00315CD6B4
MNNQPICDEPVTINPTSDLVTFEDTPSFYVPGQDVFVIYTLGSDFKPTSRDWVGVFPCGWSSLSKYLTFQWSPKEPRNSKFPNIRSVMFLGNDIQVPSNQDDKFQFLYISKQHVVGVSRSFVFSEFSPEGLTCTEEDLDSLGPVTIVETTNDQKGLTDNYDLLVNASSSDSWSDSDLPPLIDVKDTFTLVDVPTTKPSPLEMVPIKPAKAASDPDNKETAVIPYKSKTIVPIFNTIAKEVEDELLWPISTLRTPPRTPSPLKDLALRGACGGPAISVVSKPTTDKVFSDFLQLLSNLNLESTAPAPERPLKVKTAPSPIFGNTVARKRSSCKVCRHKDVILAEAKDQIYCLKREKADIKRDLDEVQSEIDLKSILLDEIAKQVKNLISENTNLVMMKEKLQRQTDWWECSSCKTKDDLTQAIGTLRSGNKRLCEQNKDLESNLKSSQSERNKLSKELDILKCQQHDLGGKYSSLEQHLNDIMFTLSTKGVDKIVDRNGNNTTLDTTQGSLLDIEGWQVAMPRKTGKHLATIAAKNEVIRDLRSAMEGLESNLNSLQSDIDALRKDTKDTKSERDHVKEQLDFLQRDHLEVKNQEESLSMMLGAERKQKTELIRQHKASEEDYRKRIDCLTAALEAAKMGSKCRKDQCCETTRPVSVSVSSQSESQKSLSKAVQTKDKQSTNKVRDCEPKPGRAEKQDSFPSPDTLATPSAPITIQAPPLIWHEFPMDLTSFVPKEPTMVCQQPSIAPESPKLPESHEPEERPLHPLWPMCFTKDDVKPKVKPAEKKEPQRYNSFKPLWLESLFFPSNTTKVEGEKSKKSSEHDSPDSAPKTPDKKDEKKTSKMLRFSPAPLPADVTPTSAQAKPQKTRYSGKTRKAKKAEFARMLRETEMPKPYQTDSFRSWAMPSRDAMNDFVCPYCEYFFPSGTSQMTIDRHLRFHSKLNSNLE